MRDTIRKQRGDNVAADRNMTRNCHIGAEGWPSLRAEMAMGKGGQEQ